MKPSAATAWPLMNGMSGIERHVAGRGVDAGWGMRGMRGWGMRGWGGGDGGMGMGGWGCGDGDAGMGCSVIRPVFRSPDHPALADWAIQRWRPFRAQAQRAVVPFPARGVAMRARSNRITLRRAVRISTDPIGCGGVGSTCRHGGRRGATGCDPPGHPCRSGPLRWTGARP